MRAGLRIAALLALIVAACGAFGAAEDDATPDQGTSASSSSGASNASSSSGSTSGGSTSSTSGGPVQPIADAALDVVSPPGAATLVQSEPFTSDVAALEHTFKFGKTLTAGNLVIVGVASTNTTSTIQVGVQTGQTTTHPGQVPLAIASVEVTGQSSGEVIVSFTSASTMAVLLTEWSGLGQQSLTQAGLASGTGLSASTKAMSGEAGDVIFAMVGVLAGKPSSLNQPFKTHLAPGRLGAFGFGGGSFTLTSTQAVTAEWPLESAAGWNTLALKYPRKK